MLNIRLTQLIRERQEQLVEELKEEIFENAKRHLEQRFGKFEEELVLIAGVVHERMYRKNVSYLYWVHCDRHYIQQEALRREGIRLNPRS